MSKQLPVYTAKFGAIRVAEVIEHSDGMTLAILEDETGVSLSRDRKPPKVGDYCVTGVLYKPDFLSPKDFEYFFRPINEVENV